MKLFERLKQAIFKPKYYVSDVDRVLKALRKEKLDITRGRQEKLIYAQGLAALRDGTSQDVKK